MCMRMQAAAGQCAGGARAARLQRAAALHGEQRRVWGRAHAGDELRAVPHPASGRLRMLGLAHDGKGESSTGCSADVHAVSHMGRLMSGVHLYAYMSQCGPA